MSESGWIRLHRSLQDNPLWFSERFSHGQAWVDLLLAAAHKPKKIVIKGQEIALKRGQVGWSKLTLAKRWGWSRGKVERFLSGLEAVQQIEQQTGHLTTVITLCNYDAYQPIEEETVQQAVQRTGHKQEYIYINKHIQIGKYFKTTEDQIKKLKDEDGEEEFARRVEAINDYCSNKKPYKDYAAAYRTFRRRDRERKANLTALKPVSATTRNLQRYNEKYGEGK